MTITMPVDTTAIYPDCDSLLAATVETLRAAYDLYAQAQAATSARAVNPPRDTLGALAIRWGTLVSDSIRAMPEVHPYQTGQIQFARRVLHHLANAAELRAAELSRARGAEDDVRYWRGVVIGHANDLNEKRQAWESWQALTVTCARAGFPLTIPAN